MITSFFLVLLQCIGILLLLLLSPLIFFWILATYKKRQIYKISTKEIIKGDGFWEGFYQDAFRPTHHGFFHHARFQRLGEITNSFVLHRPTFYIADPLLVKKILFEYKSFPRKLALSSESFFSDNLLMSNGAKWEHMRSLVNPSFRTIEDNCAEMFHKRMNALFEVLMKQDTSKPIHVSKHIKHYAIDCLTTFAYGQDAGMITTEQYPEYLKAYYYLIDSYFHPIGNLFPGLWKFLFPSTVKEVARNTEVFTGYTKNLMNASRKKIQEGGIPDCLLDALAISDLDDDAIQQNLIVFFFAGHESTHGALDVAMYHLAKYPHIQDKILEEVERELAAGTVAPSKAELEKLTYLNWFIHENIRRFPPFPVTVGREALQDQEIAGYFVPKGTLIGLDIHSIHHNPKHWTNPYEFRPERFSPEESKGRSPFAFMPFATGPRTCIGKSFSMLEQRVFLSAFVRKFKVRLADPNYVLKFKPFTLTLLTLPDFKLILEPR